jgi:hypothetical protein
MLMSSLHFRGFCYGEFVLVKSYIDILRHLRMSEPLHCCTMGSPLNMGWGPQGSRSARSEPQRAWDSFGSASQVFESPIGGVGFGSEMVFASSTKIKAEKGVSEEGMLVNVPTQELKPRRRGRPRKDTTRWEETHLSAKLSTCPGVEEFVELPHLLEPVGIIDRGDGS